MQKGIKININTHAEKMEHPTSGYGTQKVFPPENSWPLVGVRGCAETLFSGGLCLDGRRYSCSYWCRPAADLARIADTGSLPEVSGFHGAN